MSIFAFIPDHMSQTALSKDIIYILFYSISYFTFMLSLLHNVRINGVKTVLGQTRDLKQKLLMCPDQGHVAFLALDLIYALSNFVSLPSNPSQPLFFSPVLVSCKF